jgi:hypothetical protein
MDLGVAMVEDLSPSRGGAIHAKNYIPVPVAAMEPQMVE